MSPATCTFPATGLLAVAALLSTAACDPPPPPANVEARATGLSAEDMVGYLERTIATEGEKMVQLARAMPEETYDWRPMEGVRSVGEVFIHVAADNWYGPAVMGVAAPGGTGVTSEGETVAAYQKRDRSKEQILLELEDSFEHILQALGGTRGSLATETTLGSGTVTHGDVWVRLVTHMHEHLGQSIAYARANGVIPPWSM